VPCVTPGLYGDSDACSTETQRQTPLRYTRSGNNVREGSQYGRRSINTPRQCTHTDKTQSRTGTDKISQKLRRKHMIRIINANAIKLVKSSLLRPRRQYSCTPNLDTACTWVVNLTLQPLYLRDNQRRYRSNRTCGSPTVSSEKKKISFPQRKSHTGPSDPQRGHTTPTASELNTSNSNTGSTVTELTVSSVHTIIQCVRK
jgi:hypothetical protein